MHRVRVRAEQFTVAVGTVDALVAELTCILFIRYSRSGACKLRQVLALLAAHATMYWAPRSLCVLHDFPRTNGFTVTRVTATAMINDKKQFYGLSNINEFKTILPREYRLDILSPLACFCALP